MVVRSLILFFTLCSVIGSAVAAGGVTVTGVTAQQRYPWNGLVDIVVTIFGDTNTIANTVCTFAATNSNAQAAVKMSTINQIGCDTFVGDTCTRRYLWNATTDVGGTKIDDLALTVDVKELGGVQLWENGPYWAECNVGASSPEEYGYYFWWGDTVGYTREGGTWTDDYYYSYYSGVTWVSSVGARMSSSPFSSSTCTTYEKDNSTLQSLGYIDSTGNLVAAHDAATAHLGAPWRMPTDAEFSELFSNCDETWTTKNGVYGLLVTGRGAFASKNIFLPAAGDGDGADLYSSGSDGGYWSSTPHSDYSYSAWYLYFCSSYFDRHDSGYDRYRGQSVRPLRGFAGQTVVDVGNDMTTHFMLDCRTGIRVPSSKGEVLRYDASWYENGDQVRITDNGSVVTNGTSGSCIWYPMPECSLNTLKLEILSNGEVIATETAQFALGYVRNVTARQLWPHKKVEVCYTLADDIGDVAVGDDEVVLTSSDGAVAQHVVGDRHCTPGQHCVVWDVEADGFSRACENMSFSVSVADASVEKVGTSSDVSVNISSQVKDGMNVSDTTELVYSPLDEEEVTLGVNGAEVATDTKDGSFVWSPAMPGTYVLTHQAGEHVFTRKVVCTNAADMTQLEIGWLNGPVSNYFPVGYASVTNVVFAPILAHLPKNAFDGCSDLDLEVIDGIVMYKGWVLGIDGECPEYVDLPEGTRMIADGAFRNCSSLIGISIPESCMSIGAACFYNCKNITSVTIPSSVSCIGECAFEDCSALNSFDFEGVPPEGVEAAGIDLDVVVRYNMAYEDEWLQVIEDCGWTNAMPYVPVSKGNVSFVAPNGEASVASYVYTSETYGVLPEARREGCTFAGWYTTLDGTNRVSAFSAVDPNVTTLYARWVEDETALYAQWEANRYSVSFNANGGEGEMSIQPFLYDQAQPLDDNAFTKLGYTFKGWSIVPDGEVVYSNKVCVSNLTAEAGFAVALFAKWEKVIDIETDVIEEWILYDLAPTFKRGDETRTQYRRRFEAKFGDDYATAFFAETGKIGMDGAKLQVWHDYVAGTDPLDSTSQFKATVTMEGGVPVITWDPALNGDGVKDGVRRYKVLGAKTLGGGWSEVNGDEVDYRFFKVTVEMP